MPFPELPPETQTGKNTFGCLVDDEYNVREKEYETLTGYFGVKKHKQQAEYTYYT